MYSYKTFNLIDEFITSKILLRTLIRKMAFIISVYECSKDWSGCKIKFYGYDLMFDPWDTNS